MRGKRDIYKRKIIDRHRKFRLIDVAFLFCFRSIQKTHGKNMRHNLPKVFEFCFSRKTNISNSIVNDMVVDSIIMKNSNINSSFKEKIFSLFFFIRKKKEGRLPHILSKKAQTLRGIK